MMGRLFEYLVVFRPKVVQDAQGNETQGSDRIVTGPCFVLARADNDEVSIRADRAIPEEYLDRLDQVEIVVRPF